VFVTHDQEEALEVADRVVVFNHGRIEQVGTPQEVYHRPATPFVHRFLGTVNVFHGRVDGGSAQVGALAVTPPAAAPAEIAVFVRPHDVQVARVRDQACALPARVVELALAGPVVRVALADAGDGRRIEAELSHERQAELRLAPGDAVFLGFARYEVYDRAQEAAFDYQI
jgi:sulfate transport system ATP-binding protein